MLQDWYIETDWNRSSSHRRPSGPVRPIKRNRTGGKLRMLLSFDQSNLVMQKRRKRRGYTHSAVTRLVNLKRDACSNECGCWATLCGCHRKREKGEKKKSALCNCHSAIVLNDSLDHCSCLSCTTAVVVYESYPRETATTGKTVFSSNSTSSQPTNQPTTATMYKEHLLRQWARR